MCPAVCEAYSKIINLCVFVEIKSSRTFPVSISMAIRTPKEERLVIKYNKYVERQKKSVRPNNREVDYGVHGTIEGKT